MSYDEKRLLLLLDSKSEWKLWVRGEALAAAPRETPPGETPSGETPSGETPSGETPSQSGAVVSLLAEAPPAEVSPQKGWEGVCPPPSPEDEMEGGSDVGCVASDVSGYTRDVGYTDLGSDLGYTLDGPSERPRQRRRLSPTADSEEEVENP